MTRTWFPEAHYMPDGNGGYRPTYKWHVEDSWTLVPGRRVYSTAGQAIGAARDYLIAAQRPIRAERTSGPPEPDNDLGRDAWLQDRAGRSARDQQAVLKSVIVKGRQVAVERRRIA